MLRTRLITAAILLPALLALVILARPLGFTAFIALVTLWGLVETAAMVHAGIARSSVIALLGLLLALPLLAGLGEPPMVAMVAIASAFALTFVVGRRGAEAGRDLPGWRYLYAFWVAALFPYFALLRNSPHGIATVVLMLLLVVASDSGAYFTGRTLGKHKLLPRVSPNKTIEGAAGGLLLCVAVGLILRQALVPSLTWQATALLAVIVGLLAQIGDLANSAYKRIAGVKDSGWIFPGHGGLLDRTCSLVFPAVFTYYFLRP